MIPHKAPEFVSNRQQGPLVQGQDIQPREESVLEHSEFPY